MLVSPGSEGYMQRVINLDWANLNPIPAFTVCLGDIPDYLLEKLSSDAERSVSPVKSLFKTASLERCCVRE